MGEFKKSRNFREYAVWRDAVDYATFVYEATSKMPWLTSLTFLTRLDKVQTSLTLCSLLQKFEKKGLCDQLQRAVISISSNIAEGAARPSDSDFAHFLDIALGSAFEVETQLLIAKNIGYIKNANANDNLNANANANANDNLNANANDNLNLNDNKGVTYEELLSKLQDIERQLNGLISTVRNS